MVNTTSSLRNLLLATAVIGGATGWAEQANAELTLTAAGVAEGFTLSTFVSGFPDSNGSGSGAGPIGVGFPTGGGTFVTNYPASSVVTFTSDADGQTLAANGTSRFGYSSPAGAATIGGIVYVVNQGAGDLVQLNVDGSINHVVASGFGTATGLAANPLNGHLYISNVSNSVYDVDPATGLFTTFLSGPAVDGLSVSPDGSTLFAEANAVVYGYSTATGALTYTSGFINTADGAAAAGGSLTGELFVNTNDGNLFEVNLATNVATLVASGGSRGDLVTVDPNGSLLLSQSNSIVRLTLPAGANFTDAPEPASLTLLGLGMAAIGILRRRKR